MICEMCNYQQKPESTRILMMHLENCDNLLSQEKEAAIVWRRNQLVATLNPKEGEKILPFKVKLHDDPVEPAVMVPTFYTPNVQHQGEVSVNDKQR